MLSDPVGPGAAAYGVASTRLWHFVDLSRRLDFLLAGFGWCRMPEHLVATPIAEAKLIALEIEDIRRPAKNLLFMQRTGGTARLALLAIGYSTR